MGYCYHKFAFSFQFIHTPLNEKEETVRIYLSAPGAPSLLHHFIGMYWDIPLHPLNPTPRSSSINQHGNKEGP